MIYYVEDDPSIRDLVVYTLCQTGLEAKGLESGEALWQAVKAEGLPELLLLDVMLPGEDGIAILKKWRQEGRSCQIPVIMLTAKGGEYDKVMGLDSGADDYITKPFGMMELLARIRAVLRRAGKENEGQLMAGPLVLSEEKRTVTALGKPVNLTFKEFELLRLMMANRGIVFSREKLLNAIWGYDYYGGTRTVDVHIQTLRQKLGDCAGEIQTVRGVGYRVGG